MEHTDLILHRIRFRIKALNIEERWSAMSHEMLFSDEETTYGLYAFVVGDIAE